MAPGKRGEQAILARPRQSLCETCRSNSDLTALTNTQYVTFLTSEVLHAHRSDCSLQIAPQLQPSDASGFIVHCCMLHDVLSTMPHRALTSQIRHLHRPAGLKRWVEANKACPAGWRQVQPRQQDADTHRTLLDLQQLPHRERYHRMRCRPVNTAVRTACLPECNWAGEAKPRYGDWIPALVTRVAAVAICEARGPGMFAAGAGPCSVREYLLSVEHCVAWPDC